jgi:hypothetical protein
MSRITNKSTATISYDERKLAELILYISQAAESKPKFGATHLNKVLCFADFISYENTGKAITGAVYQCLQGGPAPRRLLPVVAELQAKGHIEVEMVPYLNGHQKRLIPRRDPDLGAFDGTQIALVDRLIEELSEMSAGEVSDLSHTLPGWRLAGYKEDIPYESIFLADLPILLADHEAADELTEQAS